MPELASPTSLPLIQRRPTSTFELGESWAANSVNCVPFRYHALLSRGGAQYGAYYNDSGAVVVFKRVGTHIEYKSFSAPEPSDAHCSISLGFDERDALHVCYGGHNSQLFYLRASEPLDITTIEAAALLIDGEAVVGTYPYFLLPSAVCGLSLIYREGYAERGAVIALRWLENAKSWAPDRPSLLNGRAGMLYGAGPYLNTPVEYPNGDIGLFHVWRTAPPPPYIGEVWNSGIGYFIWQRGSGRLCTQHGVTIERPVWRHSGEWIYSVPLRSNLINQAGAALLPNGEPAACTYWGLPGTPAQIQLVIRQDGVWTARQLTDFKTEFTLTGAGTRPLPLSRPVMLACELGILVLYRSSEQGGQLRAVVLSGENLRDRREILLWEGNLGHYEPVMDLPRWSASRILSMYIQKCTQPEGDDGVLLRSSAVASIAEWDAEQLFAP